MESRRSQIILNYNGKKATETITGDSEAFTWTDCASGEADTISLTLDNHNLKWLKGKWFPVSGDYIKAGIRVLHWNSQSDNRTGYCGKFTVDEISGSGSLIHVNGISIPINTSFNVTARNRTYRKTSVKSIMEIIAGRAGIKLVFSASDCSIDEISQSAQTDMEFAFSLCTDYDLGMKVYNEKLVVYDKTQYEKRKKSFTIDRIKDHVNPESFDFTRSASKIYDGVKLQYTNKDGKNVTYRYVMPGKKGKRLLVLSESADSHADAERKAKAKLAENLRSAQTITIDLMGDPKYEACKVFELTGFGKLDGRYFIDKAIHMKDDGYTTTIQCHKCVTNIK